MSDSSIDPEPLDAEFEPADTSEETPPDAQSGSRLGGALISFALASLAGGALGYTAVQFFPSTTAENDPGANDRAALSQTVTGLQTRLAAIEAEDPANAARAAADASLSALEARIAALENQPASPETGSPADLSAIEARLADLENAPASSEVATTFDASGLEARLDALETAQAGIEQTAIDARDTAASIAQSGVDPLMLQNLSERIAALETASDQAAAPSADQTAQIVALADRIAELENQLADARTAASAAQLTADGALAAAERQPETNTEAERVLAARAIALTALRDSAASGGPFEAERAALARLWRGNSDLAALASYSRAGAPTREQLRQSYPGQAIRNAAGTGQRLWGLLQIRRVEADTADRDPLAVTSLAEAALADQAIADAVTLTEQLDGAPLDAARAWLLGAQARLDTDARLEALRQNLAETAAELGTDPS